MKELENYWNNKWKKQSLIYEGRTLRRSSFKVKTDVRTFINKHDDIVKAIVNKYELKKDTYNETAYACQKFVVEKILYQDDLKESGVEEYWQYAFETLSSRVGDCEDGAILMANLMIQAGIPNWRVKVAAGYVQEAPTAPTGGHAYCLYLADRENNELEWEIHDWCYHEDTCFKTGSKPLAKDGGYNGCYKSVMFTFNDEFAWSSEINTIGENRVSEVN